jgi:hypothetical protein
MTPRETRFRRGFIADRRERSNARRWPIPVDARRRLERSYDFLCDRSIGSTTRVAIHHGSCDRDIHVRLGSGRQVSL